MRLNRLATWAATSLRVAGSLVIAGALLAGCAQPATPLAPAVLPQPHSSPGAAVPLLVNTPTQPPLGWLNVGAPRYGLSWWQVPRNWLFVEEGVVASPPGWLLLDARRSLPATQAPPGVSMVLSVYAVPAADPPAQPAEAQPTTVASRPAWLLEEDVTGDLPGWRATAFVDGSAAYDYDYVLTFDCATPATATAAERAECVASCRDVWKGVLAGVQVAEEPACTTSAPPTPGAIVWRQVTDAAYDYAFDVPSGWLETEHATGDRLVFFSDPAVVDRPEWCPLPNGLLKLDFAADPPLKEGPDLARMTPTVVAGQPAWIASEPAGEAAPNTVGTVAYIRGPRYHYLLSFLCTPPSQGGGEEAFAAACDAMIAHILESFRVLH